MIEQLWQFLPDYDTWTRIDFLYHLLWGLLGASIRLTHSNAPLKKPEVTSEGLRLNAVAEFFVSASCGMLANTHPIIGVGAAFIIPDTLEEISRIIQRGLRQRIKDLVLGAKEDR